MSEFCVYTGGARPQRFERPRLVLRAPDAAAAREVFARADEALREGSWIAGMVEYEGGATLGIFDAPEPGEPETHAYALGGMRRAVADEVYDAAFARIARAIYEGDVYQVNLTVPFDFAFDGDAAGLYADLARTARAPYAAFVRDGERAVVSISPELFLRFDGTRVSTRPMKGTAPLDRIAELDSAKNRAEHLMIVDLLRNDLHRFCTDVRVDELFAVERYPTFATMTSTISGALDPATPLAEIFRAAFPCGSVTGAPKRAAMGLISAVEGRPRGAYCGSIGFLSPRRTGWWNVAIRTAQIDVARGTGRFDAGGGIVADSSAEDERREIALKARFFVERAVAIEPIETFAGGDPVAREAHLARMGRAAAHVGLPFSLDGARRATAEVDAPGMLVRLRLGADGVVDAEARPLERPAEPVPVCISAAQVRSEDPLLRWKTTWRPAYDRAAAEAKRRGCFDALLTNERGELTEGARTNLFARIAGRLVTPPEASGLLPGILRARLLADGTVVEATLRPEDLRAAEAIFVGNSARGMLRARLVETETA